MATRRFRAHMIHYAMLERPATSRSSTGAKVDAWSTVGTLTCRYVQDVQTPADRQAGQPKLYDHYLLTDAGTGLGTAIRTTDRIGPVFFASGGTVDAGPFSIDAVLGRNTSGAHHIRVDMRKVK